MGREKMGTVPSSDTRAYEYGEGTASAGKRDRQTASKTGLMDPKEPQKHESALGAEYSIVEDIGSLDASEVKELVEFMEAGDSIDTIPQRSEEDDDSESVRRLYVNPRHIVPKGKNQRYTSKRTSVSEGTEEGTRPTSRWRLSACRSCGSMIRFRSDELQPPTCGKPQCIEKFEERSKNRVT